MEEKFLNIVADAMGVEVTDISMDTQYKVFANWDSIMMLTLIMEVEGEYGVIIPIEKAGDIKKLKDLFEFTKG